VAQQVVGAAAPDQELQDVGGDPRQGDGRDQEHGGRQQPGLLENEAKDQRRQRAAYQIPLRPAEIRDGTEHVDHGVGDLRAEIRDPAIEQAVAEQARQR